MSMIRTMEKHLRRNPRGITVSKLAQYAKTDRDNVYRIVYDLKQEGAMIDNIPQYVNRQLQSVYYADF